MQLFTFRQTDFRFDFAAVKVHVQRHNCIARAFGFADEFVDFALVQKQLARTDGVRTDVRGGSGQRGDVAAHQVKSVFFPIDIAFLQLHAPRADGFYFPAFQHQACLNLLFDIIIVEGLAVVRNRHGRSLQNV